MRRYTTHLTTIIHLIGNKIDFPILKLTTNHPDGNTRMVEGVLASIKSKNFYEILNVGPEATTDQIKDSYKEIAKLYHPDSNFYSEIIQDPLSAEEQEIFKLITDAYTTLTNKEKRATYDLKIPKGLKSWGEEEESSQEKERRQKTQTNIYTDTSIRAPGTIDLARFKNIKKNLDPQATVLKSSPAKSYMALFLFLGLCLACTMCVSIVLLVISKKH